MRAIRRGLQVVALVGTLLVGVVALTLIVSQTPWFRDWLRRYIVRESKQYLNGELSIGGLNGNLLFGVGLSDVAVDVSGQQVIAIKGLEVNYSVFQIISTGIVLDEIKVIAPTLRIVRDETGWNLAHLVKEQAEEADRKGPGRPVSLPSIQLTDGTLYIDDRVGSSSYRLPQQIDGLQVKGRFEYAPVHYTVQLADVRFRGTSPDLTLQQLAGGFAVRNDNLYIEQLTVKTGESALAVDGAIEKYLQTPVLQLAVSGTAALPELARVAPALEGYTLRPAFEVKASGPTERLGLDLNLRSEAGNVRGTVTTDLHAPDLGVKGELDLEALDLAPLLKDAAQKSDLTGHAKVDLTMASAPAGSPAMERLRGSFAFTGPRVVAAGYSAADVNATGTITGPKITLEARAAAYGGAAAATGFIVTPAPGRPLSFDLRGSASGIDLRNLPAATRAPKLATNLSVSAYHVRGAAGRIEGTATLRRSEVEGATVAEGTSAEFATSKGTFTYAARGAASNLDLQRVGRAFKIPAFDNPESATTLHSTFDVKGSGAKAAQMTLDATGTLTSSDAWGAHLPQVAYEVSMASGKISYAARGAVEHLNLQRIGRAFKVAALDKPEYDSTLNSAFDVKGAGTAVEEMVLDASGTLTNSDLMGAHFPQLGYEAHLNNGALDARADGRFENLDPGAVSNNPTLNGTVTGSAKVAARIANVSAPITPDAISAEGSVLLEPSKVGDLAIDSAVVEGRYASRIGDLTRLSLAGPDVKLEASGRVALDKTSDSNLKYRVDATDLSALARLAGLEGVAGLALLEGTLTGNAASLRTTGTMNGSSIGYQANSALDLNTQYTVTVPDLQFAKAEVKATTAATFVKVGGQEINEIKATTTYGNSQLAFETNVQQGARALDASGTVVLHPDHQEIHLPALALRTQGVEWRTAPGSEATVKYGGDRVEMQDVRLVSGDQSIDVAGALALKGDQPNGALTIQARNVDIAQVEKLALQNRGLTGRVDVNARIEGTAATPNVTGDVTVTSGGFQAYKYDSLKAAVSYNPTTIGLDATLQQSATESLRANGTIPMTLFSRSRPGHVPGRAGDEMDLRITSTPLSLGLIQGFTTAVTNVTGLLRIDLRLTGSGQDPHAEGIIDISGGSFGVPTTGVSYTGLDTSIAVSPDSITIPRLEITDEEGEKLTIVGTLGVHARQLGAVDVTISSRDFELIDNQLGDVGVETAVKITGELRRPKIVGQIELKSGRLEVDKILALFYDPYSESALPDVVSAERSAETSASAEDATRQALAQAETSAAPAGAAEKAAQDAPPAPAGAVGPVELQLTLRIPENLVLRGKGLRPGGPTGAALGDINLTLGGNLEINKPADGQMTLLGSVETIRGTYEFQGRRFDLVRGGTVRFIGEPQINPLLDINATRTIPNTGIEARVHITGTAKAPELQLTSNPPLEESDILALIVFNRPVNELGSGEKASLAATAGGIATGFLAAPLGDSIGRALDLDLFEITTTTESGELGAGVTLGQQIGDRMFFRLRQQFGERLSSEFMLEYQLADFLRMQATAAPEPADTANRIGQRRIERAGVNLIFFFSY